MTNEGITMLPQRPVPAHGESSDLSPAAQAAVARMEEAVKIRTSHRVIEAEEAYGLRAPPAEVSSMLPPSARHALIQGGPTSSAAPPMDPRASAADVAAALRRGVPSAQPPKRIIEQQRKQRKHMRSSAYTLDPSQRFVYEAGDMHTADSDPPLHPPEQDAAEHSELSRRPASDLANIKLGELALPSRATAPDLPPGKVFVGGKYTLSPAQSWRLSKIEQKYDFEVLDTVIDETDLPAYLGKPAQGMSALERGNAKEEQGGAQHGKQSPKPADDDPVSQPRSRSIEQTVRAMAAEHAVASRAHEAGGESWGGVDTTGGGASRISASGGGGRKRALRGPRQRLAREAARLKEHFTVQAGDVAAGSKHGGGGGSHQGPRPAGAVPGVSGEDSDLEFFMAELGEEGMGGYGDVFSDGEEGVTEALTYPTRVHLTRALARGEVNIKALSASSRSALEQQLRSSRLPEHRAVVAGIRAMRAQLQGSDSDATAAAASGSPRADSSEPRR